jgi:hypothetical protein
MPEKDQGCAVHIPAPPPRQPDETLKGSLEGHEPVQSADEKDGRERWWRLEG